MRSRSLVVLTLLATGGAAHAAGLSANSTPLGARARGLGGAFCGIADDPTALYYNPAGLSTQKNSWLVGLGYSYTDQKITPPAGGGKVQDATGAGEILPTLGYVYRPSIDGHPSRGVIGVGLWRTFGAKADVPSVNAGGATSSVAAALYELDAGFAYDVSDVLQIGGALRLGLGTDVVNSRFQPIDADISGKGIGFGATLGLMFSPTPVLRLGLSWRSGMNVDISGSGKVAFNPLAQPNDLTDADYSLVQRWPQSAALAVVVNLAPAWHLAVQADWTDWSTHDTEFRNVSDRVAAFEQKRLDMEDTMAYRLGVDGKIGENLGVRAGYAYETQSIPDGAEFVIYADGPSHTAALGGSYQITPRFRVDLGLEYRRATNVVAAAAEVEPVPPNSVFSGDYEKTAISFELGVGLSY